MTRLYFRRSLLLGLISAGSLLGVSSPIAAEVAIAAQTTLTPFRLAQTEPVPLTEPAEPPPGSDAEPDPFGGLLLDPYLLGDKLEITSVQVRLLDPEVDAATNEALRQQILTLFPLTAGDSFDGNMADQGIARIRALPEVARARYEVRASQIPGRVNVLLEVEQKIAAAPAAGQLPSAFGVFAPGGTIAEFPLLYMDAQTLVVAPLYGAIGVDVNANPWFNNSTQFPNVDGQPLRQLPADTVWGEAYVNQSLYAIRQLTNQFYLYGGLSLQVTSSFGFDTYGYEPRDRAYVALNEGFVGFGLGEKRTPTTEPWGVDLSYGQQNYQIGTGMLIWQGTQNGNSRGVLALNTRQSFSNAALLRLRYSNLKVQGFYLESNPLPISPTQTDLAGVNVEYTIDNRLNVGLTYIGVTDSQIPTRKGLQTYDARFWAVPFENLPGFFLAGEYAYQQNQVALGPVNLDVSAQGGYIQIGNRFTDVSWQPQISYRYAYFSGDRLETPTRIEKFDPLYYGGNLQTWYQGLNFAYIAPNANEVTHQFSLTVQPAQNLGLSLQYILIYADQPFQTLSGTTPLPSQFLGQEVNVSVLWNITPKFILAFTGAVSFPGDALINATFPNRVNTWTGVGMNLIWSF